MAPKAHRAGGPLRTHSRNSSATKVGGNHLQFTQKDPTAAVVKSKRLSANERSHSTIRSPPAVQAPPPTRKKNSRRAGFTIAQEDEDEWTENTSGANTPPVQQQQQQQQQPQMQMQIQQEHQPERAQTPLPRVPQQMPTPPADVLPHHLIRTEPSSPVHFDSTRRPTDTRSEVGSPRQPRPASQRHSMTRPPSTHSVRSDAPLRPHPLIRGQSHNHAFMTQKPTPLAALTVIPPSDISTSSTLTVSPPEHDTFAHTTGNGNGRRTSVSSVRSVATLPVHSSDRTAGTKHDRTRALSTISLSGSGSSSAALSSLTHLPMNGSSGSGGATRPSTPQMISFFPPVNPHINLDAIHPLLPGPYLVNHLSVLNRRIPLRESYDRVARAKAQSSA